MVYRLFVEKKPGFDHEASALCEELKSFLGIQRLGSVRVLNRYDVENTSEATLYCSSCLASINAHLTDHHQ